MCTKTVARLLISSFLFVSVLTGPAISGEDWAFLPPFPLGDRDDVFTAVDGTASDEIWAVGVWQPPDWNQRSLIEHFDGMLWTRMSLPAVGSRETLSDVVAVTPDRALAVGTYTPVGTTVQPFAMEWNGTEWALISAPGFSGGRSFEAIDETPSGEIWVAGYQSGTPRTAFIARRADGDWSIEMAPPVGNFRNRFYAIHASAADQIWVVGTHSDTQGQFRILIQRYDGNSSWTTFDIPTPGLEIDALRGVLASAPDDVWAVGYYYHAGLFLSQPLIMHYDGISWAQVQLPDYPEGSARLESITAAGPDNIYAAGTYATAQGRPRPFMLHYDGAAWSEVVFPQTGGSSEWFLGMCAAPDGDVWAVGQYFDGSSTEPMAFRNAVATTAVGEAEADAVSRPSRFSTAAPNPFRFESSLRFSLDRASAVRLRVWDAQGRLLRTLVDGQMGIGVHIVQWDGRDLRGRQVSPGVYFYDLQAGGKVERQKIIRMR